MNIITDFLRLFAGFSLQVLPYAFLCFLPFSDTYRLRHSKAIIHIVLFSFACIFAVSGTVIYYNFSDEIFVSQLSNFVFMLLFGLCIIFFCYIIKAKLSLKIYVASYIATFAFFVSLFVTLLWQSKLSFYFPAFWDRGSVYTISYDIFLLIATILVFPVSYLLVKKMLIPSIRLINIQEANSFAWLSAILLLLLSISYAILDYSFTSSKMAIALCLVLCFAVCAVYFISTVLLFKIRESEELQTTLTNSRHNEEMILRQYQHIQNNIQSTNKLRHNFRQQLITLRGLCEQPDGNIRSYLSEYLDNIPDYVITPLCTNPVFNSILSYYKSSAEGENIKFSCSVNLPAQINISETDIVIVIGNLLENAIDAAKELDEEEAAIAVNIDFSNKMIGIAVDNTFDGKVVQENNRYISTKHDSPALGLQSIYSIAEKYNGKAFFRHDDKMFFSSVMLANILK